MRYFSIIGASICCLIYVFAANAGVIEITKVKTNELFPVEYQLYAEQPTGYVEVTNTSDIKGQQIRVDATVEIKNYTADTVIRSVTLASGKSGRVPLLVAFKPNILALRKPLSQLTARIEIVAYSGEEKIDQKTIPHQYAVYSLNRMPKEAEKLAMFVNPKDPIVSKYLADKGSRLAETSSRTEIAEKLYAMLQASQIKCFPIPVGKDVKHPRGLLRTKMGNSYDCSLLYAALLERYKVPAALAFVPQKYMIVTFESPNGPVTWDNRKWTPVDMRELKAYADAQVAGITAYNKWAESGELKLVDLRKTWHKYQPVQFETIVDVMRANKIESGIKLAQQGELDNALMLFTEMLEKNKNDPVVINNLGNLHLLKGDLDKAISTYQQAISRDAEDAAILLNIGIAYYMQGNDDKAVEFFTQARERLDNYTRMCILLGIKPDEKQYADLQQRLEKADGIVREDNEVISRPLGTRRVVMFAMTTPVYWKQK